MKKIAIILFCAMLLLTAFVSYGDFMSGIRGTISPADGAIKIWAINGKDSASIAAPSGIFTLDLKPGNWKLYIQAAKPYKDVTVPTIYVDKDRYYDVGEIKLVKE